MPPRKGKPQKVLDSDSQKDVGQLIQDQLGPSRSPLVSKVKGITDQTLNFLYQARFIQSADTVQSWSLHGITAKSTKMPLFIKLYQGGVTFEDGMTSTDYDPLWNIVASGMTPDTNQPLTSWFSNRFLPNVIDFFSPINQSDSTFSLLARQKLLHQNFKHYCKTFSMIFEVSVAQKLVNEVQIPYAYAASTGIEFVNLKEAEIPEWLDSFTENDKVFDSLTWTNLKTKYPLAKPIGPVVNALAVTTPRSSTIAFNDLVLPTGQPVPKFIYKLTEFKDAELVKNWYSGLKKNLTMKQMAELKIFEQLWVFCPDCLKNFLKQLVWGKMSNAGEDVKAKTQFLRNDQPVCPACYALLRIFWIKQGNPALMKIVKKHLQMTDDQLYADWQTWYQTGMTQTQINDSRAIRTANQVKAKAWSTHPLFSIRKPDSTRDKVLLAIKPGWAMAQDRMSVKVTPYASAPENSDQEICGFDPNEKPKALNKNGSPYNQITNPRRTHLFTFRYDAVTQGKAQGNYMLQWFVSLDQPSYQNELKSNNSGITRVPVGITHTPSVYGALNFNEQETHPSSLAVKLKDKNAFYANPFSFLQASGVHKTSLVQGYWEWKFRQPFKAMIEFMNSNGIFARIDGGHIPDIDEDKEVGDENFEAPVFKKPRKK